MRQAVLAAVNCASPRWRIRAGNGIFFRRALSEEDQFFFLFEGHKYQDQPVWLTRLSGYWNTFLRNLGFNAPVEPVLGIVASATRDLNAMPWQELADHVAALRR
jgi:hypothetical protein